MLTYRDFDSRQEFVEYLGLYRPQPGKPDFRRIDALDPQKFSNEIKQIHQDIENVRQHWNDQSITAIEQTVARVGQEQIDIMAAQKRDKLRAGYNPLAPMYRVKNCDPDSFFTEYGDALGFERPQARYHVQFPGEVTAWHTDIYSPVHEFLAPLVQETPETVGLDKNIRRILIALEPWHPGEIMLFGQTAWTGWKAGEVIYWEYGVPHGTANTGYVPRISVSITGLATSKFCKIIGQQS